MLKTTSCKNFSFIQTFIKEDHKQCLLSKDNASRNYVEECIIRGLFRGYEDEAQETPNLNNAQGRRYLVS